MTLAIGIATVVYVAVSLGVFGTLTVDEVIAAGPTAIAVAAKPDARATRVLADDGDGAVRDSGRDERRPLPGERPRRAPRRRPASSRR